MNVNESVSWRLHLDLKIVRAAVAIVMSKPKWLPREITFFLSLEKHWCIHLKFLRLWAIRSWRAKCLEQDWNAPWLSKGFAIAQSSLQPTLGILGCLNLYRPITFFLTGISPYHNEALTAQWHLGVPTLTNSKKCLYGMELGEAIPWFKLSLNVVDVLSFL